MPQYDTSIPNLATFVINPIVEQTTINILKYLKIYKYFNNNIYYHSRIQGADEFDNQKTKHKKSSITNRIDVNIVPIYNPQNTKGDMNLSKFIHTNNSTSNKSVYPIFADTKYNIELIEFNAPFNIQMVYKIRTESALADEVMYTLYNSITSIGKSIYTEIEYYYPIPPMIVIILHELYKLMDYTYVDENNEIQPIPFQGYIQTCSNTAIDIMTNRYKSSIKQLCIMKDQNYTLGTFEYSMDQWEPNKENKLLLTGDLTFTFTIQFAMPSFLRLRYPIVINNKYLDKKFIKTSRINYMQPLDVPTSFINEAFDKYYVNIRDHNKQVLSNPPEIVYPSEDEWIVPLDTDNNITSHTQRIIQGILEPQFDVQDSMYYVSLNLDQDLYPILDENQFDELKECIKYFFTKENWTDVITHRCPLCCYLFANNDKVHYDYIELIHNESNESIIQYKNSLITTYKIYRILIGLNTDYYKYDAKYILDLFKYPKIFGAIIVTNINRMVADGFVELIDASVYEKYKLGYNRHQLYNDIYSLSGIPIRIMNYYIRILK